MHLTRFLNHIFKIAEAQGKLNLTEEVDEVIADETQKALRIMLVQYGEQVKVFIRPSEITTNKFLEILENTGVGITVEELCRLASKEDPQIAAYLGTKSRMESSWYRPLMFEVDCLEKIKVYSKTMSFGTYQCKLKEQHPSIISF